MERTVAILIVAMGIIQGSIAQEADTTEIILPKNAIGIIQNISPKVADTTDVIIIENEELQEKKRLIQNLSCPRLWYLTGL